MIKIFAKAHSHLPIYLTLKPEQKEDILTPAIGSRLSIPIGDYVFHFMVGKIEYRDGSKNIYSSNKYDVTITRKNEEEPVTDFWISTPLGEILIFPKSLSKTG